MDDQEGFPPPTLFGLLLRCGLFLVLVWLGGWILGGLLYWFFESRLLASALGFFAVAMAGSAFVVRAFERGTLSDIGFGWEASSARQTLAGAGAGSLAALAAMLVPAACGLAQLERSADPANAFTPGKFLFVSTMLLFGAVGEELLFRGYAFQLLLRRFGAARVILPFGALFGAAHAMNPGATALSIVNTALWGILLGYAFHRARTLWLPIGLHFGWNWALPLFGVQLSGFTMGTTGYTLRWTAGPLWSGGAYGVEAGLPTTVVVLVLLAGLWRHRFGGSSAPCAGC
jgi:membrane protease YdiL (CAAX protease family)